MYAPITTDHTRAVLTERLRDAEAIRLARRVRRTTIEATATPASGNPPSLLGRWTRRTRLLAAS